jgi:hypothetical protein
MCVWGAQFLPNTSHVLRKRQCNTRDCHQADPAHCYKFHILQQIFSTYYLTILFFGTGEDDEWPGLIPGFTVPAESHFSAVLA